MALKVFSAKYMRPLLRHKFANLTHMALSSMGLRTSARTCRTRCQTSTSGWQPCNLHT